MVTLYLIVIMINSFFIQRLKVLPLFVMALTLDTRSFLSALFYFYLFMMLLSLASHLVWI